MYFVLVLVLLLGSFQRGTMTWGYQTSQVSGPVMMTLSEHWAESVKMPQWHRLDAISSNMSQLGCGLQVCWRHYQTLLQPVEILLNASKLVLIYLENSWNTFRNFKQTEAYLNLHGILFLKDFIWIFSWCFIWLQELIGSWDPSRSPVGIRL